MLTSDELLDIAARGATLSERLAMPSDWFPDERDPAALEARLATWRAAVGDLPGDRERLERRWVWSGWNSDDVRRVLASTPRWRDDLPAWVRTVADLHRALLEAAGAPPHPASRQIPFIDLLDPLVGEARRPLGHRPFAVFGPEAWSAVEDGLRRRLHACAGAVLLAELDKARGSGRSLLLALAGGDIAPSDERYRAWVDTIRGDGGRALLLGYPRLARAWAETVEAWRDEIGELVFRVERDRHALSALGRGEQGGSCGRVAALLFDLSDPHRGHRAVHALRFEDGTTVVYKPKSVDLDQGWARFQAWLGQRLPDLGLRPVQVLPRDGYGWCAWVEARPAQSQEDVSRFYERSGVLLACMHLFGGTDAHSENFIAERDQLTLVDVETLVYPEERSLEGATEAEAAGTSFRDSVLHVGMLPRWELTAGGAEAFDLSALGGIADRSIRVMDWLDVGTDDMRLAPGPTRDGEAPPNALVYDGRVVDPSHHGDALVRGFEAAHRALETHRRELLGSEGPLAHLADAPVRFIVRATRVYTQLLERARSPHALADGVDASLALEPLARGYLGVERPPPGWRALSSELQAMERHDVPFFTGRTDGTELQLEDGTALEEFFVAPPLAKIRERAAERWGVAERSFQVELIRASLAMRTATGAFASVTESALATEEAPWSTATIEDELRRIADLIEARCFRSHDGSAGWFGLRFAQASERFQLLPLGEALYDGVAGIAVFLAAAGRRLSEPRYVGLAQAAVSGLRRQLEHPVRARDLARRMGLGAGFGLPSLAYALAVVSNLTEDDELRFLGGELMGLIPRAAVAADTRLDALGGCAGILIVGGSRPELLRRSEASAAMETACARLLATREAGGGWRALGGGSLTGMSHGAAGIVLALARAREAGFGGRELHEAVEEGLAFERRHFRSDVNTWADLRTGVGDREPMNAWCNGASGIGLARIATARTGIGPQDELRRDIEAAVSRTDSDGRCGVAHPCCGDMGRAELLLEASFALERPHLRQRAQAWGAALAQEGRATGHYQQFPGMTDTVFSPSFFQGLAGIGYGLLRLEAPEVYPSVLTWS